VTDEPTIVVEVRGPSRSGVTTFTELLSVLLRRYVQSDRLFTPPRTAGRAVVDLVYNFQDLGTHVEVREATPDDRDRELASLRRDVERLQRRQIPESWSSSDGTEWSGISGDGVVDVRGSKADIDVVQSWRHAKDRLAWFEEEYRKSQARETAECAARAVLAEEIAALRRTTQPVSVSRSLADMSQVEVSGTGTTVDGEYVSKAKFDRLLTAFHDATRRPMGVTPDSGLEFYDWRMADEAEARRTRHGRGPK